MSDCQRVDPLGLYHRMVNGHWGCLFVAFFDRISQFGRAVIIACWLVVPPIYFFIEFHYARYQKSLELENIKDSQALAGKIWAGVAAAVAILYFKV